MTNVSNKQRKFNIAKRNNEAAKVRSAKTDGSNVIHVGSGIHSTSQLPANENYTYMNKSEDTGLLSMKDGFGRCQEFLKSIDTDHNNLVDIKEANNISQGIDGNIFDRTGDGNVSALELFAFNNYRDISTNNSPDPNQYIPPDGIITPTERDYVNNFYQQCQGLNATEVFTRPIETAYFAERPDGTSLFDKDKGPNLDQVFQ